MIAHLSGHLFSKTTQSVIIEAGGIGYEVFVPLSTLYALPGKGETANLHVYTHVREDTLLLFGFQTLLEKDLFLMLISVTGIGPKLGLNILSGIGPQDLLEAISRGDSPRLQAIPGIGRKIAERLVLELKDRARQVFRPAAIPATLPSAADDRQIVDDALSALVNLGYPLKQAERAVKGARSEISEISLEALIREALKALA